MIWDGSNTDVWIVRVTGRLDLTQAEAFEKHLREKLESDLRHIVVDLAHVKYMSSSGLGSLLSILRYLADQNKKMALCALPESIRKLLQVVEVDRVFPVFPREAEAIAAVTG